MRNLLLLLVMLCPVFLFAQDRTVKGTVKGSDTKETLPQVNVVIKGTTTGTTTELDGSYTLVVPQGTTILVFSYLGYEEQEIDISKFSGDPVVVNISLKTANVGLNTVVVSASKRQEKVLDAPASVTVIGMDKIQSQAPLTVADNLKNTPGVDVMMTGLVQSNINIRGFNNIFSGAMLTIVDYRFAAVPSLKVNAFQLIPNNTFDMERMEIVRGPGSALYGPNAADGVLAIFTRSPLDMTTKYETTVSMSAGVAAGKPLFSPEFRHAGKIGNKNKWGYKISGSYLQGTDFEYYDPREPSVGDSILFGNVSYGNPFVEDTTIPRTTFDRDFKIQNYSSDIRLDYRPTANTEIIVNGGFSTLNNIELTGLGAGQGINWRYYYAQARFRWKNLFVQYFVNISDAGDTYLIPQVGADASPPHKFQLLVDKSKQHVGQIQHSWRPIPILNFVYGLDAIYTTPETEGTINGRFEDDDNIFQTGLYLQGEVDAHEKLKFVGAMRADYHNRINNVFFSPRVAMVFKPTNKHTIRLTYNRAFSSPQTLNLFLDLSNGLIPNGINIRGIGNADGYNYRYGDNGLAQFRSSYIQTNGTNTAGWYSVGDLSDNYRFFDEITAIIADGLASSRGLPTQTVTDLVSALTVGIAGPTGSIQNVGHTTVDYVKLAGGASIADSQFDITDFSERKGIDNSITQTYEVGYKGILGDKFFFTADGYYTRVQNYVSPLTLASASVLFDPTDLIGALGGPAPGGQLYDNIENSGVKVLLLGLLDNDPSFQDPSGNIPSINGEVWDEIAVILMGASRQIPVGTVTPEDELVNSDVILTYVNLGTISVGGMDFSLNYLARPDLSFSSSYSFINKDRIPLAGAQGGFVGLNAPKHRVALSGEYINKKTRLTTRATWRWQSGFPANSSVYVGDVDAAHLVDLNVNYKVHGLEGLTLTVDVNNLLNNKWQRFPGTPPMGTILIGKVTYTFTENTFKKQPEGVQF